MHKQNHDPDGLAYELEVARGTRSKSLSKRKAAERIWTAIATGTACEGTIVSWCEYVAQQITKNIIRNNDLDASRRGSLALECIGLYQRDDEYRQLRSYIEMRLEFEELVTPKDRARRRKRLTPTEIVKEWQSRGHFQGVKIRAAAQTVKRQWNQVIRTRK